MEVAQRMKRLMILWLIGLVVLVQGSVFGSRYSGPMVEVQAGSFEMRNSRHLLGVEVPPDGYHTVVLEYDYLIGRYEVTFDLYDAYCRDTGIALPHDGGWGRGNQPVIFVSWLDAIAFCNWVSAKEGLAPAYDAQGNLIDKNGRITQDIRTVEGYRLPTEAEWEYAAKGGHKSRNYEYSGSSLINEVAWFLANAQGRPHPVGQKKPNELGLYDMSGNVEEMVYDRHTTSFFGETRVNPVGPASGNHKTKRGGSFAFQAGFCAIEASRNYFSPSVRFYNMGFRIARTKDAI
jgi:formylglycine-generating enzyme required for sulfatase activity